MRLIVTTTMACALLGAAASAQPPGCLHHDPFMCQEQTIYTTPIVDGIIFTPPGQPNVDIEPSDSAITDDQAREDLCTTIITGTRADTSCYVDQEQEVTGETCTALVGHFNNGAVCRNPAGDYFWRDGPVDRRITRT